MNVEVIRAGILTSIQDLGRRGWQRFGIAVGGALDTVALRVANILVGNPPGEAALEVTLVGPTLRFSGDALISICGGDLLPRIGDAIVPSWRPVWIRNGTELRFGSAATGCRAYVAVAGGFDVPEVIGSRSTYFQAGLGGLEGRALHTGDRLPIGHPSPRAARCAEMFQTAQAFSTSNWSVSPRVGTASDQPTIRVCPGRHLERFSDAVQLAFTSSEFEVTSQSDRKGYRLAGPQLVSNSSDEILSEAVTIGTVQVPPNGQPIVLMADGPVTGGYPKIAQVAAVDIPVLAQVRPGARVRFRQISIAEAQFLYREQEFSLARLQCALEMKVASAMASSSH